MTLAGRVSVKDLEQCEELGLTYAQLFKVCVLCVACVVYYIDGVGVNLSVVDWQSLTNT
jgi:hypothetical protein